MATLHKAGSRAPSPDRIEPRVVVEVLSPGQRFVKRVLDVAVAVPMIVLLVPFVCVAAAAIRLDSGGPAFLVQRRVGKGGREFRLLKLRTMHVGNDDSAHRAYVASLISGEAPLDGGMYKLVSDPRITRVGKVLRRFSIDEIPQLLCVLRGRMSVVGPRPPLPGEVALYDGTAWQRLYVKPGLTGPWQVNGRSLLDFEAMVALDVDYWRSWRFRGDLSLLARTPVTVLSGRGAA